MIDTSQIKISTMFSHANQHNQEKADMTKQIAELTYKCPKCSITFDQWKDLKIHNKNKKPEMQTCTFCSFKSCTFLDMENHSNSNHENEMNNVEKSANLALRRTLRPKVMLKQFAFLMRKMEYLTNYLKVLKQQDQLLLKK